MGSPTPSTDWAAAPTASSARDHARQPHGAFGVLALVFSVGLRGAALALLGHAVCRARAAGGARGLARVVAGDAVVLGRARRRARRRGGPPRPARCLRRRRSPADRAGDARAVGIGAPRWSGGSGGPSRRRLVAPAHRRLHRRRSGRGPAGRRDRDAVGRLPDEPDGDALVVGAARAGDREQRPLLRADGPGLRLRRYRGLRGARADAAQGRDLGYQYAEAHAPHRRGDRPRGPARSRPIPGPDVLAEPELAEQHFGEWQGVKYTDLPFSRATSIRSGSRRPMWRRRAARAFVDLVARVTPAVRRLTREHAAATSSR